MTDGLATKARRIAEIIDRNLYRQDEKVEDAKALAIELADELARIRAETAKNSGEVVAYLSEQMIDLLKAGSGGAYNGQVSNVSFSRFTVPVYTQPTLDRTIRDVLAPFAKEAEKWPSDVEDSMKIACCSEITVGNLRATVPLYATPSNSPLELTEKQIDAAQFCLSEFFPKTDGVTLRIAAKETVEAALDTATPANSRAEQEKIK